MPLIAKPAVRRVNRVITLPKAVRSTLKATPQAVAGLKKAAKTRNVVTVKRHNDTPNVSVKFKNKYVPKIRKPRKQPKVKYVNREVSEKDRDKIKSIRGVGKGKILAIFGNGPSLLEVDAAALKNNPLVEIMMINKPDPRVWPTEYWLFCDHTQLRRHQDAYNEYKGPIFNTGNVGQARQNVYRIKNIGGQGFSLNLAEGFHIGRSSVYAAMQVALWLGHDHIYLFGVDMTSAIINGQELVHYFGINPDVKPKNRVGRFDNEAKHYEWAAKRLDESVRKKFTFCSSYLKYDFANRFNRIGHEQAATHITEDLDYASNGLRGVEPPAMAAG